MRPDLPPVKRTALGRIKHEGATAVTAKDGKVVVYSGDDQVFEYIYKYVSADKWRKMRGRGESPLDRGTLYVAKFNADGSGEWLPLVHGVGPLTAANGFPDQATVLVRTRQAADAVGATKMDRPEWITHDHLTGEIYVTCSNNSRPGQPSDRGQPTARQPVRPHRALEGARRSQRYGVRLGDLHPRRRPDARRAGLRRHGRRRLVRLTRRHLDRPARAAVDPDGCFDWSAGSAAVRQPEGEHDARRRHRDTRDSHGS